MIIRDVHVYRNNDRNLYILFGYFGHILVIFDILLDILLDISYIRIHSVMNKINVGDNRVQTVCGILKTTLLTFTIKEHL